MGDGPETEIVERAEGLVPLIEAHRSEGETNARLAPEVVDACRGAGLFGLFAPVEVGGAEVSLTTFFRTIVPIAAADPSVAWYMVNSTAGSMAATLIDESWWPRVYQPPLPHMGLSAPYTGRLEATEGGYRLSGTWPLMTGVRDARWGLVNARAITAEGKPEMCSALVPTSDLLVDEVWHDAVAMRATGSHQISADDVFVPAALTYSARATPRIDRPLYRCSYLARSGAANAGVPIGILRSALDAATGELREKVSTVFSTRASESTAIIELVADASLALTHLEHGTIGAMDALWSCVERGDDAPAALRAAVVGAPFRAVDVARTFISTLYARSSRAAFFRGHPLERALRNIHAVAYGLEALRPLHHAVGRVTLGLDAGLPI